MKALRVLGGILIILAVAGTCGKIYLEWRAAQTQVWDVQKVQEAVEKAKEQRRKAAEEGETKTDDGRVPSWVGEYVKALEDSADLMEKVTTLDELADVEPRMSALQEKIEKYTADFKRLTVQDAALVSERYGDRISNANRRMKAALPRIQQLARTGGK